MSYFLNHCNQNLICHSYLQPKYEQNSVYKRYMHERFGLVSSTETYLHLGGLLVSLSRSALRDPGTRPASSLPDSVDAETSSPESSESLP